MLDLSWSGGMRVDSDPAQVWTDKEPMTLGHSVAWSSVHTVLWDAGILCLDSCGWGCWWRVMLFTTQW